MADVQTARYGRYVQALFNLKQALTLGEALPDVVPSLDLENPRPENEIFLGNDLCQGYGDITAAAGENPQVGVGFRAAPGARTPGAILVVDKFTVASPAAQQAVTLSFGSISTGWNDGDGPGAKLDTRRYPQAPAGNVRERSNPVNPAAFANLVAPTSGATYYGPWVLVSVPGLFEVAGLIVTGQAVLSQIRVTFSWRERALRPDELIL